ncbi:hypothetical protein Btru_061669 [Bulinus truncatus]|nr:hypothetical protein Btru_061669 [Bulinus truncatus]
MAYGQTVAQSTIIPEPSIHTLATPFKAIDGYKINRFHRRGCSHTSPFDENGHFNLTFSTQPIIQRIVLFNRADGLSRRMDNFTLTLLAERNIEILHYRDKSSASQLIYSLVLPEYRKPVWRITVRATTIPYGYLHPVVTLCELETFGDDLMIMISLSSDCVPGTWGLDCSKKCPNNCNAFCSTMDGSCLSTCMYGTMLPDCIQVVCPKGSYGRNCSSLCNTGCYKNVCNVINGFCLNGCLGYSDQNCSVKCDSDKYGYSCSKSCDPSCWNNTCNNFNGTCDMGCDGYMNPPKCDIKCPDGKYGRNCEYGCSYCKNNKCNHKTGYCELGCIGFIDFPVCRIGCPHGRYGVSCSSRCSTHCYKGLCNKYNGTCDQGCDNFQDPPECQIPCNGTHGLNCACQELCKECKPFSSTCSVCKPGYSFHAEINMCIFVMMCQGKSIIYLTWITAHFHIVWGTCSNGWFGSKCIYQCHCISGCSDDGNCLKGTCSPGWFGHLCQHQDLITTYDANISVSPEQKIHYMYDNDEQSCEHFTDLFNISISFNVSIPFTFVRIYASNRMEISLTMTFTKDTKEKEECNNMNRIQAMSPDMVDIYCQPSTPIISLELQFHTSHAICSLYIDGGRNMALGQTVEQSSDSSDPKNAIDGIKSPVYYNFPCSHTLSSEDNPHFNLTYDIPVVINRIIIYNRGEGLSERLYGFILRVYNEYDKLIFEYNDTTVEPDKLVFTILLPVLEPVWRLVIYATQTFRAPKPIVTICEIETFGDCPSYLWDLTCTAGCDDKCFMGCSSMDGSCNYILSDYDLRCAVGWFGPNCRYKCYCTDGCDRLGNCLGSTCETGWFGYLCQYVNVMSKDLTEVFSTAHESLEPLFDENDETCVKLQDQVVYISIMFVNHIVFSFLRLHFKDGSGTGITRYVIGETGITRYVIGETGITVYVIGETGILYMSLVGRGSLDMSLVRRGSLDMSLTGITRFVFGETGITRYVIGKSEITRYVIGEARINIYVIGETGITVYVIGETRITRYVIGETRITVYVISETGITRYVIGETGITRYVIGETGITRYVIGETGITRYVFDKTGITRYVIGGTGITRYVIGETGKLHLSWWDGDH